MLELTYNGSEVKFEVSFRTISEHVCEVVGSVPHATTGFTLSRIGKQDGWDYSGYTTIFRELDNGVQYSNDGSVYVPPVPPPEPPKPLEPTLDETKDAKVAEMEMARQERIAYGAEVQLSDGTKERFTLTDRDQLSLMGLQLSSTVLPTPQEYTQAAFPWHPADESVACKFYSQEDMLKISKAGFEYVLFHVTYFRDLRIFIRSLGTKEAVESISYGANIPLEYQSEPLKKMLEKVGV